MARACHLGYDERMAHRVLSVVLAGTGDVSPSTVPMTVERFFTT